MISCGLRMFHTVQEYMHSKDSDFQIYKSHPGQTDSSPLSSMTLYACELRQYRDAIAFGQIASLSAFTTSRCNKHHQIIIKSSDNSTAPFESEKISEYLKVKRPLNISK